MDYNDNNVYNVSEEDVKDVEEIAETPEKISQEELENWNKDKSNIDIKGIMFSVASIVLGGYSFISVFMWDYSLVLAVVAVVASVIFSIKYLIKGYRNKVFNKLVFTGFSLAVLGLLMGVVRFILACIAAFGQTIFTVLF